MLKKISLLFMVIIFLVSSYQTNVFTMTNNWQELILNNGFDEDLSWWLLVPQGAGTIQPTTLEKHSGSMSIEFDDVSTEARSYIQTPLMPVNPTKKYYHSWWAKGDGKPTVVHLYYDSDQKQLGSSPTVSIDAPEWTPGLKTFGASVLNVDYVIPSNAAYIRMRYYSADNVASTGKTYYDDISFGRNISTDATLSELLVNDKHNAGISLSPSFSEDIFSYWATVDKTCVRVYVTPAVNNLNCSSLSVNGKMITDTATNIPVDLKEGINNITIHVVAEDETTYNDYKININKLSYSTNSNNWNELISNNSFEDDLNWWKTFSDGAGTILTTTLEKHSGDKSVHLNDTSTTSEVYIQTPLISISSAMKYNHSWWVKGIGTPKVEYIYYNSAQELIDTFSTIFSGSADWTRELNTLGAADSGTEHIIPSDAAYIKIRYYATNEVMFTGQVYLDDIGFGPFYSDGIDIPEGPPSVLPPGGDKLPPIWAGQPIGNHGISAISDTTFPNETLNITGDELAGAKLRVWGENYEATLEPIRTENLRMQVVIPANAPISTMLAWPIKNGSIGSPIRVNGATAWWAWPVRAKANTAGQTVRIFGKNLKIGNAVPVMYMKNPDLSIIQLEIINSTECQLEAKLPDNLRTGTYTVWAHNGTGGKYGWSKEVTFTVENFPSIESLSEFSVDAYGAIPNDGQDDYQSIANAMVAAQNAGGGIVRFSEGEYNISKNIIVNAVTSGIHLRGAGMGDYDNKGLLEASPDVVNHGLSGTYTLIRHMTNSESMSHTVAPTSIIDMNCSKGSVKDMTIINSDFGVPSSPRFTMRIYAYDVTVENCRMISVDARNLTSSSVGSNLYNEGVLYISSPGDANIVVKDCDIHTPNYGIRVMERSVSDSTNFLKIENVNFTGYYAGKHERDRRTSGHGLSVNAITGSNIKNAIVEKCTFKSGDRAGGKLLNRMFLAYNNSNRHLYVGDNIGRDLGPHPSAASMETNCGEQILFHEFYPHHGGLFDVLSSTSTTVTVDNNTIPLEDGEPVDTVIDNKGSQLPNDIMYDKEWIAYICAGKGAGQYRVLQGMSPLPVESGPVTLSITEPWRINPDNTSKIMVDVVFRQNIVYNNDIQNPELLVQSGYKTIGTLFFYKHFDSIVMNNTFRNLAVGVAINTSFRQPTGWNLIRNNRMDSIGGTDNQGGDSSPRPSFFSDIFRSNTTASGWTQEQIWFSVSNIARGNIGTNGKAAVILDTRTQEKSLVPGYSNWEINKNRGSMMSIIENNIFSSTDGIIAGKPTAWSLFRNNKVTPSTTITYDGNQNDAQFKVIDLATDLYDIKIDPLLIRDINSNTIEVKTILRNTSNSEKSMDAILALYDINNMLHDVRIIPSSINGFEEIEIVGNLSKPDDLAWYNVKVFTWTDMEPLAGSY